MSQPITGVQRYAREVIAALVKSGETQFKFIIAITIKKTVKGKR